MPTNDRLCIHVHNCFSTGLPRVQYFTGPSGFFGTRSSWQQPFNGVWSGTTRVGRYQKKHSPTHTHPDHQTSFINFLHLLQSIAFSLFSSHYLQCFLQCKCLTVLFGNLSPGLFGLSLGLGPSTSYSMHFFTQSSSFHNTCLYHRSLFGYRTMLSLL